MLISAALLCAASIGYGAILVDPIGDTLGSGAVQYDIVKFEYSAAGANLQFHVDFAGPITPFDSADPNSIFGYVEIDSDNNASTGVMSPFTVLTGVDFVVVLETETLGMGLVPVFSTTSSTMGSGTITYGANFLDVIVDSDLIGGGAAIAAAVAIGTITEQTDRVPNTVIPEPSSIVLTGAVLAVALTGRLFRSRRVRSRCSGNRL
jgi:hypothetical protein